MDGIDAVQARIAQIQQRFTSATSRGAEPVAGSSGNNFAALLADATSNGADPSSVLDMLTNNGQAGSAGTSGIPGFTPAATSLGVAGGPTSNRTQAFVDTALRQDGDTYRYAATAKASDPDPSVFDCSELTMWAAAQVGVDIPDGAAGQYNWLKKQDALMPVEEALKTRGALLFHFDGEPKAGAGEPSVAHVAISLGDGRTIEARGKNYGVGIFEANTKRFNYAGFVPGLK